MATTLVTSCQTQPSNNKSLFSSPELTSTKLLQPTTQKSVTLHNRIVFPSICTYSAKDGCLTDSQLTHYGALAASGPGLVIIETTAVEAHGRTTVYDSGIWKDEQVESLSRVASLIKSQGSVPGIQLSHSGSKPYEPSIESRVTRTQDSDSSEEESEAFEADNDDRCPQSNRLTITEIRANVQKWADSAILANRAGIEVLEINAANRHLLHYFLSGNLNTRTDFYGGSLQNRMRFPLEVARAVRAAWPEEKPLWFRLPTTDFANAGPMDHDCDGWDVYQAIEFGKELKKIGIDIITVSNGTTMVDSKYPTPYTCQAQVSNVIKHEVGIQTGSTGNTRTCDEAESVLQKHQADYIIIGSECLLRHCVSKKDVPGHTADNVSPSESSMLMSMCTLAI